MLSYKTIGEEEIRSISNKLFQKAGVPEKVAQITTDVLVKADLRGFHSHGVTRIKVYIKRLMNKLINPSPFLNNIKETNTTSLVDGDNGLGQFVGYKAMKKCINKADEFGVAMVGVKNNNHIGMASYFSMMALEKNMIGITICNTSPHVAPWGGNKPLLGTNPVAVAIPTGYKFPIVLDMSTTKTARGNIIQAYKNNEYIPDNYAFDKDGQATNDPAEALKGSLAPIGEHKGYGLSLCIDVLCGVLTGSLYGPYVPKMTEDGENKLNQGAMFKAIKISNFIDYDSFLERTKDLIEKIKNSEPKKDFNEILIPGEKEYYNENKYKSKGIPLKTETIEEIKSISRYLSINNIEI